MVGDGSEALASAPVFAPDVVLLDIGLPMMDGYQVARRLREVAETRASCLIALTGYGQPADRERARVAGFDHHLTKPADPDALLALVDAWIESSGAQRAPARAARPPSATPSTDARSTGHAARPHPVRSAAVSRKNFSRTAPLITLCITRLRSSRRRCSRRAPPARRSLTPVF